MKKSYGNFLAIDLPSLTLAPGVYWLRGENGSGKTSFLKMIGGLHPFEGDILLDEISLQKQRVPFLQQVNYAEAEPLYPHFLTGKDLVQLYCKTKRANEKDTLDLLDRLHIRDAYNSPVGTYSSGMQKKLSLALAFTGQAKWVLLDEPLITIDVAAIACMVDLIHQWHTEKGVSFIITSHQAFAQQLSLPTQEILAANKTIVAGHV